MDRTYLLNEITKIHRVIVEKGGRFTSKECETMAAALEVDNVSLVAMLEAIRKDLNTQKFVLNLKDAERFQLLRNALQKNAEHVLLKKIAPELAVLADNFKKPQADGEACQKSINRLRTLIKPYADRVPKLVKYLNEYADLCETNFLNVLKLKVLRINLRFLPLLKEADELFSACEDTADEKNYWEMAERLYLKYPSLFKEEVYYFSVIRGILDAFYRKAGKNTIILNVPEGISLQEESVAEEVVEVEEKQEGAAEMMAESTEVPTEVQDNNAEAIVEEIPEIVVAEEVIVGESVVDVNQEESDNQSEEDVVAENVIEETIEPFAEVAESIADTVEEVSETIEPVLETTESVSETIEPVLEVAESVSETAEPVSETTESVSEALEPVLETTEPISNSVDSVSETVEPIVEPTEPIVKQAVVEPEKSEAVLKETETEAEVNAAPAIPSTNLSKNKKEQVSSPDTFTEKRESSPDIPKKSKKPLYILIGVLILLILIAVGVYFVSQGGSKKTPVAPAFIPDSIAMADTVAVAPVVATEATSTPKVKEKRVEKAIQPKEQSKNVQPKPQPDAQPEKQPETKKNAGKTDQNVEPAKAENPVKGNTLDAAREATSNGDFKKAFDIYKSLANAGNAEAQYCLGLMYETGKGVDVDIFEAVMWFRKAKAKGFALAERKLMELGYN